MKKLILSLIVLIMGGCAMAQNVIGDPIYYTDSTQYRPGHGIGYADMHRPMRRPPMMHRMADYSDFNHYFVESRLLVSPLDVAFGFDAAFVPGHWGGYVSNMYGVNYDWITLGAVYRLSQPDDDYDWQLYGGLVFGPGTGAEGGIRLAFDNIGNNNFSWWSMSLGAGEISGYPFATVGISLGLAPVELLILL